MRTKFKLFLTLGLIIASGGVKALAQGYEDITASKIKNADLGSKDGWTTVNINDWNTGTSPVTAECFSKDLERKNYEISQTIHLEAGTYRLTGYAFVRDGAAATLFAGKNTKDVMPLEGLFKENPGNMTTAARAFKGNMYNNVLDFTLDSEEDVKIGFTGTHTQNSGWFIAGPVKLYKKTDEVSFACPNDITHTLDRSYSVWTVTNEGNGIGRYADADVYIHEKYKEGAFTADIDIFSKTYEGLENGAYEVVVYAAGSCAWGWSSIPSSKPYVYVQNQQQEMTVENRNTVSKVDVFTFNDVRVTDGTLKLGLHTTATGGNWMLFNLGSVKFLGDPLKAKKDMLQATVAKAMALAEGNTIPTAAKNALKAVAEANNNSDNSFTKDEQYDKAIEAIETAYNKYVVLEPSYAAYTKIKGQADAIKNVDYNEISQGAHTTFEGVITNQTNSVENATDIEAITTATTTVQQAIRTYVNGAEPKNEGEYFDITCLIVNPDFANGDNGWTKEASGGNNGNSYQCQEFWNNTFDFYQNLTDLPAGSYSLSVQAFTRPGVNGDANGGAYFDYKKGINNVHAELYVNDDASKVGNIYEYTGNTSGAKVFDNDGKENDFKCDGYWVPNNQEGASLYFADGAYVTKVAALVEDGTLKIGFRDKELTANQWTIFTNFQLHYYGSSKLVYYQQYLPQLQEEVAADLSNKLYENVFGKEKGDLEAAIKAQPKNETEDAYQEVIDALKAAQTVYQAAYPVYDTLVKYSEAETIDERTTNIGDGAFKVSQETNDALWTAYVNASEEIGDITDEQSETITAAEIKVAVDAYEKAVSDYENAELNEPAEDEVFNVMITTNDNWAFKNNPLTFNADNVSGAYFQQGVGVNANRAQQIIFTKVKGNLYKMSTIDAKGDEVFICTNKQLDSEKGGTNQIRLTTDGTKALSVKVVPTTEGVYNLINTEDDNKLLGCQDDPTKNETGGLYGTSSHSDFTITLADKPVVKLTVKAGKYATAIFPFAPELPNGVVACTEEIEGNTIVLTPAKPEANVPYILKNETEKDIEINVTGFGTATKDAYNDGDLTGVYTEEKVGEGNYVLQTQDGVQAFYQIAEGSSLTAVPYRAYLTVPEGPAAKPVYYFDFAGDATAIEAVPEVAEGAKVFYNLAGQRVANPTKGIYIVNGQKVLVK